MEQNNGKKLDNFEINNICPHNRCIKLTTRENSVKLLQGIVSLDDRLPNGFTALHLAVEENKIKLAKFLIDYGINIEGI